MKNNIYVIAEAGVNHNGDLDLAKQLIVAAKSAGADCVKFQTFKAERVVTPFAPKASYQIKTTPREESQLQMLKQLELNLDAHRQIKSFCQEIGIEFLSTPYNVEDILLLEEVGVCAYKVASGQIVEPEFLRAVAKTGKRIYLSTGMATLAEVDEALRIIREEGNDKTVLLQCTTNYPSRTSDANLRAIPLMANAFGCPVGYSDHTLTNTGCLVAIGLGACVIEKHLTLHKGMQGPDHAASADPAEFKQLVDGIREAEETLGDGRKEPCAIEMENAKQMRRSIVAARPIKAGEVFAGEMLTYKRPGSGIKPSLMAEIIGQTASRDIAANELIAWAMCGGRR